MAKLNSQKQLIVIVGPTAVGKTSLSIKLANELNCPIISFDSRQFYKEMTIGTAKPSESELRQAEHHFINSRSVTDIYTAGMFENDAIKALEEIYNENDYCVAVGGSGLYINALCYGIDDIPSDETIRKELYDRWQTEGLEILQEEVKTIDPEYYQTADIKNPRRIMRALEVYEITGQPYSSLRKNRTKERAFNTIWIGLDMPLELLYERINKRVDIMLKEGLFEEVEELLPYQNLKALKTVGYKEVIDHLNGLVDKPTAIDLIKRNTRRYARKQLTWFRKNSEINWFLTGQENEILDYIHSKSKN